MNYPHKQVCLCKNFWTEGWIHFRRFGVVGLCQQNYMNSCCSISFKRKGKIKNSWASICNQLSLKFCKCKRGNRLFHAPSRLEHRSRDTSPRRRPPWLERQWEQQLTLNSVTVVNCKAAQAKHCKCYANCESRQHPALMMHPAPKRGKSAVGRHFRIFCLPEATADSILLVPLPKWHSQPSLLSLSGSKRRINEKHSLLFYCSFFLEFQKFDFKRMCLGGISALCFHPCIDSPNHRATVPLSCSL